MKILVIPFLLLVSACSIVDNVDFIARPVVERANDKTVDRSRKVICGNTYRAEIEFINRHNISADNFKDFCGRQGGTTR